MGNGGERPTSGSEDAAQVDSYDEFDTQGELAEDVPVMQEIKEMEEIVESQQSNGASGGASMAVNDATGSAAKNSGGSPPPGGGNTTLVGANVQLGASTTGEDVEALDADLQERLRKFDELMQVAKEKAAAEKQGRQQAYGGGGDPGGHEDGQGQSAESDRFGAGGRASNSESQGGQSSDISGSSAGDQGRAIATNAGRYESADDDIVARQLREAAENESDPVLKDKLWQEYERYKAGL